MMLHFVLSVAVFIPISSLTEDKLLKSQINDAKNAAAFNRLLSHIANVNEERLNSIKKLVTLQSVNPYPDFNEALRTADPDSDSDSSDSSESEKSVVYLVIPDPPALKPETATETNTSKTPVSVSIVPISPRNKDKPVHTRSDQVHETTMRAVKKEKKHRKVKESKKDTNESVSMNDEGWNFLRQSILRSCRSRDVKKCKKACKEAVTDSCSTYDCRKKLKRSLKRNCRKSCKSQFQDRW